jgi:hypothetical protein
MPGPTLRWRRKWLFAGDETIYGTDPTLDGSDAIQTRNLQVTPYGGSPINRELDKQTLGNDTVITPSPHAMLQFEVELTGSAAAGTAPPWGVLLKGAGFDEDIDASAASVLYTPIDDDHDSLAFYFFHEGNLQKILGARATSAELVFQRGQLPFLRLAYMGRYARPATAAEVAPDFSGFRQPRPVNEANTSFTLGAETLKLEELTINLGLNTVHRDLPNSNEIIITDRRATARLVVEATKIADYDFFADLESHQGLTTLAMELVHGGSAPDKATVEASRLQYNTLTPQNSDGLTTYAIDGVIVPGGATELSILLD